MCAGCVSTHLAQEGLGMLVSASAPSLSTYKVSKYFLLTPNDTQQQHPVLLLGTQLILDTCLGVSGGARESLNLAGKPCPPSMWLE